STSSAPSATNCPPSSPTSTRVDGSRASTRKPASASSSAGSASCAGAGPCSRATSSADTVATTPITAKTQPGEATASNTPASAGATSTLTLSIQPETTLVAVSSSGVLASDGTSAAWVGRVIVTAVAATAASA